MDNFGWVQVNSNDSSIMECEAFKRANTTKAQEFESKMEFFSRTHAVMPFNPTN